MNYRSDYHAALALRLKGKTYGEIRTLFGIPKSTQSSWFRDLKLSSNARKILKPKQRKGLIALGEFNKNRTAQISYENESIRKVYEAKVSKLNDRELMLIGAGLYWCEGQKSFNNKRGYIHQLINFSNSDPLLISIFLGFIKRILKIDENRIGGALILYPNLNPEEAITYWQKITSLPRERFKYCVAISRASKQIRPSRFLPYGTLQLKVNQRQEFFKIRGLIDGIIKGIK